MIENIEENPLHDSEVDKLFASNQQSIHELLKKGSIKDLIESQGPFDYSNARLPLEVPYGVNNDQEILTNSTGYYPEPSPEKAGFFSKFFHEFVNENEFVALGRMAAIGIQFKNPYEDTEFGKNVDWVPIIDNAGIVTPRWIQYIMEATSENDLESRIQLAQDSEKQQQYFDNGSGIAGFFGGMSGAILSPSSLIPISASVKYAKVGKNVLSNMARTLPGVATQSAAHALAIDLANKQFELSEYAEDAAIDALFGTMLMGTFAGVASAKSAAEIFKARQIVKASGDNVTIAQKIDKNGVFKGFQAVPSEGESASAAAVDKWQSFLDSKVAKKGVFKSALATKVLSVGNPIVRWLSSDFDTMADLMNRTVDHSILTEGVTRGEARPLNVEELVRKSKADAINTTRQLNALYLEANGIDSTKVLTKYLKKKFMDFQNKEGFLTREKFDTEVALSVVNDTQHANQFINEAANILNDKFTQYYEAFLEAHNLDKDIFPLKTAKGYMMRMYDRDYVASSAALGDAYFVDIVASELKRQDKLIIHHGSKLKAQQAEYERLKQEKIDLAKAEDFDTTKHRALRDKLDLAAERVQQEQAILRDKMQNDEDMHLLLENTVYLNSAEETELRGMLKPLNEATNKFQEAQAELRSVQSNIKRVENRIAKAKTEKKLKELTEQNKQLQKQLDKLEGANGAKGMVRELQEAMEDIKFQLEQAAHDGRIPKKYFRKVKNEIEFRDPNQGIKFRELFDDHRAAAKRFEQSILNYNPQQLTQSVLSNFSGGAATNPLKSRSLMVPDHILRENKFLSNDLNKMTVLYIQSLSSRTAVKNALIHPQFGEGFEAYAEALSAEMDKKRQAVADDSKLSTEQKQKKLLKLDREFKKAEKAMGHMKDFVYGSSATNTGLAKFSRGLRNYTTAIRLGGMMLSSLSDTGGIILRNGLWNYLSKGLAPLLKSAFKKAGKTGAEGKENALNAGLAVEHVMGSFSESAYNPAMFDGVYLSGKVQTTMEKLNNVAMNLYGQTFVDNINQMISANIAQAKIMRSLEKFKQGTITQREIEGLAQLGINPKQWADIFLEQFEKFGGEKTGTNFQSRYWDWQNVEAMDRMQNAVRRSVSESVLKSGWADSPFWSNDPFMSMIMLFHKWGFSAMSRWTLPTMQRPDAKALTGVTMMMSLGALVDPLRKWAKTGEFEWDDDAAFLNAYSNSSLGGWYWDVIENLNAALGHSLLPNKNDRRQQLTIGGMLAGAPGGVLDDAFTIVKGMINQNTTRRDAQKAINLLPLTGAWYLRRLTDKFLDSTNLPEQRPAKQNIFWGD